jgi:Beta-1,3-glucanase
MSGAAGNATGAAGDSGAAGASSSGAAGDTGAGGTPDPMGTAGTGTTAGAAGSTAAGTGGNGTSTGAAGSTTAGTAGSTGSAGVGASTGNGGTTGYSTNPDRVPCGTKAGQCECQPTLSERKAPAFPPTQITAPKGLLFRFMNNCPMTLWLKFAGAPNGGTVMMPTKTTQEFDMPTLHGRVTAYKNAAPGGAGSVEAEFFELTADPGKALNYNLSFVDYMGLPLEINGKGPPQSCGLTACYSPLADLVKGCPAQLLDAANGKCMSMFSYCNNAAHAAEPFCTSLDQSASMTLANDPMCKAGGTLAQAGSGAKIMGCATGSFWSGSPYCCAKVNRNATNGTGSDNTQNCTYYKTQPYNVYAAYSHSVCPYLYAFAYDDWNDQSGYHACTGGTGADITYCPGDP